MGQVTISFLGVCTIFRNLPSLAMPDGLNEPPIALPRNRVVLARARQEFLDENPSIDRHIAILQMPPHKHKTGPYLPVFPWSVPDTYALDGAQLSIPNATQTKLRGCLCDLPSLQEHLDQPLGPPAPWVYLPDQWRVQAWFDIEGGTARARLMSTNPPCSTVPTITVVTMNTDGAPILKYQPWSSDGPTPEATHVELTGLSPNINVMNFADGQAVVDDDNDFYLNYTLAATMPPQSAVRVPRKNRARKFSRITYFVLGGCGDAGPGCSNTGFP